MVSAFAIGCIFASGFFIWGINHLTQQPFKNVAREFNLRGDLPRFGPPERLTGKVGKYRVRIESIGDGSGRELKIIVMLRKGIAKHVQIKAGGWLERFNRSDLQTQDEDFDKDFRLEGSSVALLAYLNERRRTLITQWKKRGLTIQEGVLVVSASQNISVSYRMEKTLKELLELAHNLDEGEANLDRALVENARNDPHLPFRRRCLIALLRDLEKNELVLEVAREHMDASDLEVRVIAGCALGEEGIPCLLSVITQSASNEKAGVIATRALASIKHEEAERALITALSYPLLALNVEVLEALITKQTDFSWSSWTDTDWRKKIPRTLLNLPIAPDPASTPDEVLPLLCAAIGLFCETDEREEGLRWLSQVAEHGFDDSSVSLSAIEQSIIGLEALGDRAQIELLARLANDGRRPIRKAALRAARKLQERLGLSQGDGHLSLAKSQGGEVSIASETGAISLSKEENCEAVIEES